MTHSKKSTFKTIVTMSIIVCLIFGAFVYFSNRKDADHSEIAVEQTEVEKLLSKDTTDKYPPTAREVIKRYSRILKCIHGEKLSETEIKSLGEVILNLYSEELLANNPHDEYMESLLEEVKEYHDLKKEVVSYAIDSGNNVVTWTMDGVEYSRILATYTIKEGSSYNKTCEEFVLKKNQDDQWKILGWRLADKEDMK
ncbi:MAG: hypothetical protein PUC65_17155 [Clostridiales bacterium]|nr:hypothetical protein [Clostridiales bacterium]